MKVSPCKHCGEWNAWWEEGWDGDEDCPDVVETVCDYCLCELYNGDITSVPSS